MPDTRLSDATAAALAADRRALLVGQQLAIVDRFLELLRRSSFEVRRTLRASGSMRMVREEPFDLVLVVLPFPELRELLTAVRADGSRSRSAAVLLVAAAGEPQARDELLMRLANRVLPAESSAEEVDKALTGMLAVAPRVAMRGAVRARLAAQPAEARLLRLENLSASGMLVTAKEPLPVGSLFGFELELPEEPPIRGQGRVVRLAAAPRLGEQRLGVSFVAVGGEGAERLRTAVLRERAAGASPSGSASAAGQRRVAAAAASSGELAAPRRRRGDRAAAAVPTPAELSVLREELAELSPLLDDLLRRGLSRRLDGGDWYVTGVELGLESLGAFAEILAAVYRGSAGGGRATRQIADLGEVRGRLTDLARGGHDLPRRVELLVGVRPALERLLGDLADSGNGAPGGGGGRSLVAQLVGDMQRVLRARASLDRLQDLLVDLQRPGFLFARAALRRRAEAICAEYRGYGATLGLQRADDLMRRGGRREALARTEREARRADDWLGAIHRKVYTPRLRSRATGRLTTDFAPDRVHPVLAEVLAAGHDYLVRAYSAYRHALEAAGADPGLLERVARLAALVAAAEQAQSRPPTAGSHIPYS